MVLATLVSYSAQLAVLIGAALLTAWAFRIRSPRPALLFWNIILVATLLPLVFAWQLPASASGSVLTRIINLTPSTDAPRGWSRMVPLAVAVAFAIAALKLGWIALGLVRLSLIRRRSQPLSPLPSFVSDLSSVLHTSASIHVSDDVACPVAMGLRAPLVLLPRRALEQPVAVQRAIVCHELLHVRRLDWLRIVLEQVWGSVLWFHPAAHLLLSRLGLMREAVVDEETIAITGDRRAYAQALLAFAEPAPLTPLPVLPLIKPRHLPRRIALIAQEVRMSRRHTVSAIVAALLLATIATGATARRLPMTFASAVAGSPAATTSPVQEPLKPGDGVSLPRVIKEVRPVYTDAAMKQKIQGTVQMEVVVSTSGEPTNIKVTKSLDTQYGLDDAAVQALSGWRFEPGRKDGKAVPVMVTIEMTFTLKS
jgi:TonB family protein